MAKYSLFFVLFWSFISCQERSSSSTIEVQNLQAAEFKSLLEANVENNLIDVRTKGEVASGIINGAQHFDISQMDFKESISMLDKSKPVFVYCAVGGRSSMASMVFQEAGFEKVYNLSGGINAWRAAGFPIAELK